MLSNKVVVGVMGSAADVPGCDPSSADTLIDQLASALAQHGCIVLTGETSGLPGKVSAAAARLGAFTVGVSAAHSETEHRQRYNIPQRRSDFVVYTGFGLKGRNVINIRSSDIVVILAGSIGTLNEFTIAYDEGKVIGVLEGSGGVADQIRAIVESLSKKTQASIVYERDSQTLVKRCLKILHEREDNRS